MTQNLKWTSRSALYRLETYVNGLIVEWNRLQADNVNSWGFFSQDLRNVEVAKVWHQFGELLRLDIHFYLICWDKINKYFGRFALSEGENQCIKVIWDGIKNLTEKASRARDHLEHLDKVLAEDYHEHEQIAVGSRYFTFGYVDITNKGKKMERSVKLGRDEVENIMTAYEKVLSCLGADVSGGYLQSVNRETTK